MNLNENRIPLWKQLEATSAVILAVRRGESGTAAIEAVDTDVRPAVQALSFFVWRSLGRSEALRSRLVVKIPTPPIDALLCTALALLSAEEPAYDSFTLVNQAVECAKRGSSTHAQASFINACLRRFLRERDSLIQATCADVAAVWNHPLWWVQRVRKDHPAKWSRILEDANAHAPMTLRVNVRRIGVQEYLDRIVGLGIGARRCGDGAVILDVPMPVQLIPGFSDGLVSVQDAAAQLAAPLLLSGLIDSKDMNVLDACSAPGGKTGHLLELTSGKVTALELDPKRTQRIHQNLERLGLSARVLTGDAADLSTWWDGVLYDAILLDAPCSASGVVRRHPDIRWLRRESDIGKLAALQRKLMQTLWPLVKPGGRLLYCTCSIFVSEGSEQLQTFLAHNTDAVLLPSPGYLLPESGPPRVDVTDNSASDYDGFYYALLQKKKPHP
jgi:16S rRNA (cytosine967-C5)-methyltransferase